MSQLVLLVEDNHDVLHLNSRMFKRNGFEVVTAATIAALREVLSSYSPDAIVLDILLPDGNGLDFLPELRNMCDAPVLFLSSLNTHEDIVHGLMEGGDDYMTKPYLMDELLARAIALIRREEKLRERFRDAAAKEEGAIVRGPLKLKPGSMFALVDGKDALLTPREFALLLALVKADGKSVPTETLYSIAWGMDANNETRAVRSQVSRLRAKLGMRENSRFNIESEYGKGYKFTFKQSES